MEIIHLSSTFPWAEERSSVRWTIIPIVRQNSNESRSLIVWSSVVRFSGDSLMRNEDVEEWNFCLNWWFLMLNTAREMVE